MLRVSALFAALATCYGWHTIAHTLISQVAQLSLTESEKKTLSMLLDDWQPFFPNTSDLTTAAVWLDTAKCDRDEQDCKFASGDHRLYAGAVADRKFSSWHYADVPINPDGVELSEEEQDIYAEDHIVWALGETLYSLGTSTNLWSLNLNLRYMLHLMGDIHQPLHAAGMYAKPGNPWAGPDGQLRGDAGGGFTFFDAKASNLEWEAAGNLHDFWDAAGGAPRRVQLCYRPHHTTRTPRAYL